MQLILEADSSTESIAAASRGRPNPESGTELNVETMVGEKEVLVEKDPRTSVMSHTPVVTRWATRKEKVKAYHDGVSTCSTR